MTNQRLQAHSRKLWLPEDPRYTFTNPVKMRSCWVCQEPTEFLFLDLEPQHPQCEEAGWNV